MIYNNGDVPADEMRPAVRTGSIMLTFNRNKRNAPVLLPPDQQQRHDAKLEYFATLQRHRVESKHQSAFTKMIMEQARREEQERQAALAAKDREERAMEFAMRHLMGDFHDIFFTWKNYVSKVLKAKRFLLNNMAGAARVALHAWKQ